MGWLLSNGPALVGLFATLLNASTGLVHSFIKAQTGKDHTVLLDAINTHVQDIEGAVSVIKTIAGSAGAPDAQSEQQNPPTLLSDVAKEVLAHPMSGVGAGALP